MVDAKLAIEQDGLQRIIDALARRGYRVIGPTVRDGAIIYDTVTRLDELPVGWTDQQDGGRYRPKWRGDGALFGYAVGPHSWKRFLHPPAERLWQARREENGFAIVESEGAAEPLAFIGVRACELRAIAIQDRVFLSGRYFDNPYKIRRDQAFIVAVNCGQAGGTCFCVSMDAGPKVETGFDLALTELVEEGRHLFVLEVGSAAGADLAKDLPARPATEEEIEAAERVVARTKGQMGRSLDTDGLKELLQANPDHPRWDEVAERCLTCGNCTNVCPTCFCTTIEDTTDLVGAAAERVRRWDSCFTLDFSYIHGGSVRNSARSRYRQWMTHKLAHWIDQFGSSGCVGCGRCITWCPVGIDITEEAAAIRASPEASRRDADGGA
ncbi:MAG TPA: 4Fe-4S dicluster domain-containing protein [Stellaceae bacterium]|jgi:sulfhydrogenase subunit beta (sulfur reductase)|nr:4Fe-4S dicluster domain-containing protein [Stellaceae bacterium]